MPEKSCETLDPRIRRTRQLLQQALDKLLEKKELDEISVHDITDAATLNRATFYDHYADKFALLECLVGSRFYELLAERGVHFDGSCASALKAMVLAVCNYLTQMQGPGCTRQLEPHMESAIIAVVRRMLLEGLEGHRPDHVAASKIAPEMIAATASWAIYGAVKEWAQTPNHCPAEDIVNEVLALVSPILSPGTGQPQRAAT